MEKYLASFLYAAACAGIHARKRTYSGHSDMMDELRSWVLWDCPVSHWAPWDPASISSGWCCYGKVYA